MFEHSLHNNKTWARYVVFLVSGALRAERNERTPSAPGQYRRGEGGQLRRSLAAFSKSSRHGVSQRSEANWESGKDQNGRRRTMGENKKCRGHKLKSL